MAKALLLWFIWQVVLVFSYATKPKLFWNIENILKQFKKKIAKIGRAKYKIKLIS
jgi:hypothetical protein